MFYDRKQLKLTAKAAIHKTRPGARLVTLVYTLLGGVVPSLVLLLAMFLTPLMSTLIQFFSFAITDPWILEDPYIVMRLLSGIGVGLLVVLFLSILLSLLEMVLSYGYIAWSLKVWRGEEAGYSVLFDGFRQVNRVLGSGIMVGIFTTLWTMIPATVGAILVVLMGEDAGILTFFVQLAIVLCQTFISYRYCLTPYFIMSEPDMGVFESITASKTAMRGNIGKRFVLDLSYLGWVALEAGVLYVCMFVGIFIGAFQMMYAMSGYGPMMEPTTAEVFAMILPMYAWMLGAILLGSVALLPLSLWVTAYQQTAYAGFFLHVTGREAAVLDAPPIPPAPDVPTPPVIPPAPVVPDPEPESATPPDPFGQVEIPQVADPFDQSQPQAPEAPTQFPESTVGADVLIGPSSEGPELSVGADAPTDPAPEASETFTDPEPPADEQA